MATDLPSQRHLRHSQTTRSWSSQHPSAHGLYHPASPRLPNNFRIRLPLKPHFLPQHDMNFLHDPFPGASSSPQPLQCPSSSLTTVNTIMNEHEANTRSRANCNLIVNRFSPSWTPPWYTGTSTVVILKLSTLTNISVTYANTLATLHTTLTYTSVASKQGVTELGIKDRR
ncbi:hypothetical protein DEU56DRAFT_336197 [Suillus clintonianus]|uniref:uncharacterized protein n=1 Tax=Suillus clintonianus TaxID=1904413 RepID=UPI001B885700|nr:uncharacterized protein DEU56DRAFT_336197 [Suillus clintonianus]KAG2138500.1 hypothetical protein DEU56DRAFT_336197 [Suillus clintonianus]